MTAWRTTTSSSFPPRNSSRCQGKPSVADGRAISVFEALHGCDATSSSIVLYQEQHGGLMTGCSALRSQIEGVASPLHEARHVVAKAPDFSPLGLSLRTQSSPRATTRSGLVTAFQPRRPPQPDSRWRGEYPVGSLRLRHTSSRFRDAPTTFPTVPITGVVALSEPAPQWFGPVPSP